MVRIRGAIIDATRASVLHLDQRVGGGDATDLALGDLVVETDGDVLPEVSFDRVKLLGTLRLAIEALPEPQRDILTRHYLGGVQLTEIAAELGVTVARVSQVRLEAVNAVRAYLATIDVTVPEVPVGTPGGRARREYLSNLAGTAWHDLVAAAPVGAHAGAGLG